MPNFNYLSPIFLQIGPIVIYWYGLLMVLSIILGLLISLKIAKKYKIEQEKIFDLSFYLIIFGFIGARFYHVFSEFPYYLKNSLEILKIWQGGLGIFGAIIAGLIVIFIFAKKNKISWLILADIISPSLILGQGIGRWGNFFNQELFGKPTNLPWKIYIEPIFRPLKYKNYNFFHPTFLYESLWDFFIFLILILILLFYFKKQKKPKTGFIFSLYLISYSLGRFFIEFLRINPQPIFLNLRLAQWSCIFLFILGISILISIKKEVKTSS